jgi:lysophospholipase
MFHDPDHGLDLRAPMVARDDASPTLKSSVSDPLVTPVSEFGSRTLYVIKEYAPLLDSCNMACEDWARVARDIVENYDEFDAFVVLHGTDTMAYTASALAFMLENLSKTVVVTGSQIPLVRPRNDGVANLLGSLAVAGHFDIPEVSLFFGSRLLRGCRASKVDAASLELAFDAPNCKTPLAQVGIGIDVHWHLVLHPPLHPLRLKTDFCEEISVLRIYPGKFSTLGQSLAKPLKGLVLQTFGAGNGPDQNRYFLDTIKAACDRGLVVVNVTQCHRGMVEAHYATGTALAEAGVVSGLDMTCEAALVKLGFLLGRYPGQPDKVREMMQEDLRGELTASPAAKGHHAQGGEDGDGKASGSTAGMGFESAGFLDTVFNALKDSKSTAVAESALDAVASVNKELDTMDAIQQALLPTLMCAAAAQGFTEDLSRMIFSPSGGTMNTSADCARVGDYDRRTPLHLACSEGKLETVQFLLDLNKSPEEVEAGDKAAAAKKADVAAYQIIDPNAIDRFGTSPMENAVEAGHREVVVALKAAGGRLVLSAADLAQRLCAIVMAGDAVKLKLYVSGAGVRCGPDVCDYDKRTPLHIAAAEGNVACARILLDGGSDPSAEDRWGQTPKTEAERAGHVDVKAMLE